MKNKQRNMGQYVVAGLGNLTFPLWCWHNGLVYTKYSYSFLVVMSILCPHRQRFRRDPTSALQIS